MTKVQIMIEASIHASLRFALASVNDAKRSYFGSQLAELSLCSQLAPLTYGSQFQAKVSVAETFA